MPRILIAPKVFFHIPGPYLDVLQQAGLEPVYPPAGVDLEDPGQLLTVLNDGIDGVLASVEPYPRSLLEQATSLRAIARVGVGYDAVDVPACTERGIVVTITPGTNQHSVAEQAFALIFAVFRDIAVRDAEVRRGVWRRNCVRRLAGNTLGLVGFGRIGKAMVPRAHGLGLTVVAHDPYADQAFAAEHGVRLVSLEELLATSDIVSLHMPCTAETTHLINQRTLAQMKPHSVLINTSRGGLVDEAALVEALESGHLFGAGLDVFQTEPPPIDHPLLKSPRVVAAPHMGGIDQDALDAMGQLAAECLVELHAGRVPAGCVINNELFPDWKW